MGRVAELLAPEHFYVKTYGLIYQAAQDLYQKGSPIDLMIVGAKLEERGILEQVGGLSRLATLIERTVSAANIDRYAAILIYHYERRRLRDLNWEMAEEINRRDVSPWDIQKKYAAKLEALTNVTGSSSSVKLVSEQIKNILSREDLTESELNIQLEELRQELNIRSYDWKNNYVLPIKKEVDETSSDVSTGLESIEKARSASVDLTKIFPHTLASPLLQIASWLNIKPEVNMTAVICGVSALHSPQTELVLHNALNFKVKGNLYGAIIAIPER